MKQVSELIQNAIDAHNNKAEAAAATHVAKIIEQMRGEQDKIQAAQKEIARLRAELGGIAYTTLVAADFQPTETK